MTKNNPPTLRLRIQLGLMALFVAALSVFTYIAHASGPNFNDTTSKAATSNSPVFTGNFGIGTTTPVGGTAVLNGNLGVGTWSPTQRLQVIGTVSATAFVGDGSGLTNVANSSGWSDGGTNVYTSLTTDNVGIGTTTPNVATLEIVKNAAQPALKVSSTATGNGDFLVINSVGNVGIGSISPAYSLSITNNQDGVTAAQVVNINNTANAIAQFRVDAAGSIGIAFSAVPSGHTGALIGYAGYASVESNADTTQGLALTAVSPTGAIDFRTGGRALTNRRMFIDSSGNIGIGTTSPVGALTVMNGNVGIGTWSPTQRLQVVGTVSATAFVGDGSGLTNVANSSGWTDGGTNVYTSATTDLVSIGTTTPVSGLTVKGNVGIGTTIPYTTIAAPASGLIAEGNTGIGTWAAAGGRLIVMGGNVGIGTAVPRGGLIVMNGNVGIGTTTPASTLTIAGNIGIGTTTPYRTIAGPVNGIAAEGNVGIGTWAANGKLIVMGGNVGIGQTNPTESLSVYRDIAADISQPIGASISAGTSASATVYDVTALSVSAFAEGTSTVTDLYGLMSSIDEGSGSPTVTGSTFAGHFANYVYGGTNQAAYGLYAKIHRNYASNATSSYGVYSLISSDAAGVMPNTYGFYTKTTQTNGNAGATNAYGLYIGDIEGANTFGIYQEVNDDRNYFAGRVGIGTIGPLNKLVVNGGVAIGTLSNSTFINTLAPSGGLIVENNVGIGTTTPVGGLAVMNGNVGIGTWSPTSKLQVIGTVSATAFSGDGSGLTGINSGGWTDGGTNVYTSATTDLVSIGTTTPVSGLTVKGNVGIGTTIPYTTIAAPASGLIAEGNTGIGTWAAAGGRLIVMGGNVGIGTAVPRGGLIVMNGNVGIGTTAPTEKLEVTGNIRLPVVDTKFIGNGGLIFEETGDTYGTVRLHIQNRIGVNGAMFEQAGSVDLVDFVFKGLSNQRNIRYENRPAQVFVAAPEFEIGDAANPTLVVADTASSFRRGNVGIGTTAPVGALTVMNGNVGIGTWSPTSALQVVGGVTATSFSGDGSALTNLPASGGWTDGGTNVYTSTTTDNVGIGTTTPNAATLEIVKNAVQPLLKISSTATGSGDLFLVSSAGNVGIGTTNPQRLVHVIATDSGTPSMFVLQNLDVTDGNGVNLSFRGKTTGVGASGFKEFSSIQSVFSIHDNATYESSMRFWTASSGALVEKMRIDTKGNIGIGTSAPVGGLTVMNGNVGIGTWSPTARLQVIGGVTATSFAGDGSALTNLPASGGWTDGGTNVYTTTTTDNVGIGTTTPTSTLEIVKTAAGTAPLMVSRTGTGDGNMMIVQSDGNVGIGTAAPRGGLSVMNGNVGIGTTAPASKLDITTPDLGVTQTISSGLALINPAAAAAGAQQISPALRWSGFGWKTDATAASQAVDFRSYVVPVQGAANPSGYLTFESSVNGGAYANRLTVTSDGFVGIGGVTAPVSMLQIGGFVSNSFAALHINDGGSSDNFFQILTGSSVNSSNFAVTNAGNVGVGTSMPQGGFIVMNGNAGIGTFIPMAKLQVVGTVAATAFSGDGSALTGISAGGWTDGGTNVYTSATTDNVGIGTTTPTATLLVQNTSTLDSFRINDELLDGTPFIINSQGNVGIGTTGPLSEPLVVVGSIRSTSSIRAANGSGTNPSLTFENGDDAGLFLPNLNILGFAANGAERVRIDSSGNMGIGTTTPVGALTVMNGNVGIGTWSPTAKLQVIGTVNATAFVGDGSGLTNVANSSGWSDGGTNVYTSLTTDNVGIGTTTPNAATLEIVKNAAQSVLKVSSAATANGDYLVVNSQGNIGIGTVNPLKRLSIYGDDGGDVGIRIQDSSSSNYYDILAGSGGSFTLGQNGVVKIRINDSVTFPDPAFNVGVGTTSPGSNFSVLGGVGIGSTAYAVTNAAPALGMIVQGNVGIGTWAANAKLIVMGGNVGVGTTTPIGAFTVMNGNVGIGTWSPNSRFEVLGAMGSVVTAKSGDYTVTVNDSVVLVDASGGVVTITLPAAATAKGRIYNIKKTDASANALVIDANASETIDGALTQTTTMQYQSFTLVCDGSNWWVI